MRSMTEEEAYQHMGEFAIGSSELLDHMKREHAMDRGNMKSLRTNPTIAPLMHNLLHERGFGHSG